MFCASRKSGVGAGGRAQDAVPMAAVVAGCRKALVGPFLVTKLLSSHSALFLAL